jgi:hypothetical protein
MVARKIMSRVTTYWESFMSFRAISKGNKRLLKWKAFQVILLSLFWIIKLSLGKGDYLLKGWD